MGCLPSFFAATNGILHGCPLCVFFQFTCSLASGMQILDPQKHAVTITVFSLPNQTVDEATHFVITVLGYEHDTHGVAARDIVQALLQCTKDLFKSIGQGVRASMFFDFQTSGLPPADSRALYFPHEA